MTKVRFAVVDFENTVLLIATEYNLVRRMQPLVPG